MNLPGTWRRVMLLAAVLRHCMILQLCLEEEFLWTVRAVVDLVLLPVGRKDVLLQLVGLNEGCEADGTFKGAAHSLEAVFDEVTLELGWGVERLIAELAFVAQTFLCVWSRTACFPFHPTL